MKDFHQICIESAKIIRYTYMYMYNFKVLKSPTKKLFRKICISKTIDLTPVIFEFSQKLHSNLGINSWRRIICLYKKNYI